MEVKMIKSPSPFVEDGKKKDLPYVFLAGPIQGAPDWQETCKQGFQGDEVVFLNPRRSGDISGKMTDPEYANQVKWETEGLRMSDAVLFWIPPMAEKIEGREYAQTTKLELIENLGRGKKIILGISPGAVSGERYLKLKAKEYGVEIVHETLDSCLSELRDWLGTRNEGGDQFFTSDTHFGQVRALELSKRPFRSVEEMDWTMIERWNKVVHPTSIVWHLGDFGNTDYLKYLNGKIHLIAGNYEVKEKEDSGLNLLDWREGMLEKGFSSVTLQSGFTEIVVEGKKYSLDLVHEPENADRDIEIDFTLFGHIHGRQRVKRFGIDIGVDANNFTPMSEEEVGFFLNALDKGYYDNNVFC